MNSGLHEQKLPPLSLVVPDDIKRERQGDNAPMERVFRPKDRMGDKEGKRQSRCSERLCAEIRHAVLRLGPPIRIQWLRVADSRDEDS